MLPPSFWPAVHRVTTGETWPSRTPEIAARFVERCSFHLLLPLLFGEPDPPPVVAQALAEVTGWRRILEVRAQLFDDALGKLAAAMGDEPFALIKGSDYAHRLYPSSFLRPMQDIDLLVPRDRIDAACQRLCAAGFVRQQTFGRERDPGFMERVFLLGNILVEVHQHFVQEQRHSIDYEGIWNRRIAIDVGGHRNWRLDDVDALAYQGLTLAKEHFRVRLVRYVDLWHLLRQRPGIAVAAVERAREWRASRAFYGALSVACRLLPAFRTADVEAAVARGLRPPTRLFLDSCVLPGTDELGRTDPLPRPRQLWRKALLMDTWRHRSAFAFAWLWGAVRWGTFGQRVEGYAAHAARIWRSTSRR